MLRFWLTLVSLLLLSFPSFGETKTFRSYKAATETPYGDVTQLLEDSHGYLWIATWNGLVRFDGFDYRLYTRVKEDRTSLPHDVCFSLFEDSQRRLWVATGRGLAIYNREKDNFASVTFKGRVKKGVFKILEDKDGSFWALTYVDLLHYDQKSGVAHSYPVVGNDIVNTDRYIWISSENDGIRILDKKKNAIFTYQDEENRISKQIKVMRQVSNGDIYIGTSDDGLFVISQNGTLKKHFTANPQNPNAMADNFVQTLYEDKSHKVWIGNTNGNLSVVNPETLEFEPADYTLPSNIDKNNFTTYSILEDSYNNLWLGTHQFWLLYANKTTGNFTSYQHDNRLKQTISGNPITCIKQVKNKLFIGTDGGGLNTTNIHGMDNFSTSRQFGKAILDIQPDANSNRLWIGTWSNGLFLYDWQHDKVIGHYCKETSDTAFHIPSNNISSILVDGDSVWVGTSGAGVVKIDVEKRTITSHENSIKDPFAYENSRYISHLMKDSEGWIWVSSSEGLRKFRRDEQVKFPYSDNDGELPQNQIACCYEDSHQRVWVLTATNGLMLYDKESNRFENCSKNYNIPTDLKSIQEDNHGSLWLVARNRVIQFAPETQKQRRFDLDEEMANIAFNSKAVTKGSNNNIYIGSNCGMFAFDPMRLKMSNSQPHIILKDLYIWDERQVPGQEDGVLAKSIQYTYEITLEPDQNDFTIHYVAIDLEKPNSFRYSYILEGLNKEWKEAGKERQATFSQLAPGKYKFKLKATGHNGTTYTRDEALTIVILPHWWQTWWFRLLIILFPVGLVILFYTEKTRNLLFQRNRLQELVDDRTQELKQKAEELEMKNKEVEKKNEELDEMLSTKNRILSIIAHDLRNPLTAIVGMLSLLNERMAQGSEEHTCIHEAARAAHKLQEQMDNILEWARIQTKEIFYSPKNIALSASVKDAVSLLKETAEQKQISITIDDSTTHYAFADGRMVNTIIRNLINNAIKFTDRGGKINIKAEENEQSISLHIKDNGVGMDQETVSRLFNKETNTSTYGTNNEKGSGLGLKICHDFAISNKGNILVRSEKGKGTTISVILPIGEKKADETIAPPEKIIDKNKSPKRAKRYTIFLVDDNNEVIAFLSRLFQNEFDVEHANDGESALEGIQKRLPDLIISDISMPKMDGKELCRLVKSNPLTKHIPVILLTSDDTLESQIDGLELRADDYITKPFDAKILTAKVKSILGNRELLIDHLHKEIISTADNTQMPESRDEQFLRKIKEVLQENLSESNLTVEFLADKTAISRVQLFRKFKTLTGSSPSDYIKNFRLQHAAKLLKSGKYSVADVAYEVGFSDPKYFGICFSEKYKISPSAYAKAKSEEENKADNK